MAVLEILKYPNEALKQVSKEVEVFDQSLVDFIDDLEETRLAGPGAVGIAAPQVGNCIRAVIVDVSNMKRPVPNHGHMVLINPEITEWDGYEMGREGCLSVPDYTGNVIRANNIVLQAMDQHGESHEYEMEGFEARAVQHEIDHLDGLLFLDRVVSRRSDIFRRKVYKKSGKQKA
jgi:peptide deformylase